MHTTQLARIPLELYQILVDNSAGTGRGVRSIELDGQPVPNHAVPLSDDGQTHNVRVQLG